MTTTHPKFGVLDRVTFPTQGVQVTLFLSMCLPISPQCTGRWVRPNLRSAGHLTKKQGHPSGTWTPCSDEVSTSKPNSHAGLRAVRVTWYTFFIQSLVTAVKAKRGVVQSAGQCAEESLGNRCPGVQVSRETVYTPPR